MKRIFGIAMLATMAVASQAITIAQWNFNSTPADASTGTGTLVPNIDLVAGLPSIGLTGGTTATFASGDASGGSTDPNVGDDSGYNTTTYAAQGVQDKERGIAAFVDTTGYTDIEVSWDQRHSNTSSRFSMFQYTLNGTTWNDGTVFEATIGDTWFNGRTVNLTSIPGASNNASFGFRIVATYKPGTSTYFGTTANTAAGYASTGTNRFDMVTVKANPVPEPASMLAIGLGIAGIVARRRRSK